MVIYVSSHYRYRNKIGRIQQRMVIKCVYNSKVTLGWAI